MKSSEWKNKIYVGGGYLRALIARETINDVDVFVNSKTEGELLAHKLVRNKEDIHVTDNAFTIPGKLTIQIIHRWVFDAAEKVSDSFDFTICCAVIWWDENWKSYCHERFYTDIAGKRLVYLSPKRNEDAGGSMLRVLKYYQRGYRIPMDSLGAVIARLCQSVEWEGIHTAAYANDVTHEEQAAKVITGLLRVVDPNVDPLHEAHLPALKEEQTISPDE